MSTIQLHEIAIARSGDKGNHANIGVVAYTRAGYDFLLQKLTAEELSDYFAGLSPTRVSRFELPNIEALNFILYDALGGGASRSLRLDTQGKLLGTALMEMEFDLPKNYRLMLSPYDPERVERDYEDVYPDNDDRSFERPK